MRADRAHDQRRGRARTPAAGGRPRAATSRGCTRSTATIASAPTTAGQAGSSPAAGDDEAGERSGEHDSGARGSGGAPLGRPARRRLELARERSAASADPLDRERAAHGSAISAAKWVNDSSAARNASRFVRLETGSSSEARVGEVRARVQGRAARRAARARGGGERGGREQHDRRVEAEHRGHRGGRREHEREQPPRRAAGADRDPRRQRVEQPGPLAAVAEHEQPGRAAPASGRSPAPRRSRRPSRARRPRPAARRRRARPAASGARRGRTTAAASAAASAASASSVATSAPRGAPSRPSPRAARAAAGQRAGERAERLLVVGRTTTKFSRAGARRLGGEAQAADRREVGRNVTGGTSCGTPSTHTARSEPVGASWIPSTRFQATASPVTADADARRPPPGRVARVIARRTRR